MSNIVIVGSGPAGVSAALYAVRAGVQTTVLTKGSGALARAEKIENYLRLCDKFLYFLTCRHNSQGTFACGDEGCGCVCEGEELFEIFLCEILKTVIENIV